MALRTLDTTFAQVLVEFPLDDNYTWHHRVLLVKGDGAQWVWATPTRSVQTANLALHTIRPLRRNAPFPLDLGGDLFAFDPFEEGDELRLLREANALAVVLGWVPAMLSPAHAGECWKFSDPALVSFGLVVPDTLQADTASFVIRGHVALVLSEGNWTTAQRVVMAVESQWLDAKRSGPGRDLRIASCEVDSGGRRHIPLAQSVNRFRDHTHADWPFRGPKASIEGTNGVLRAGCEFSQFDGYWRSRSGIAQHSAIAVTHRNLFAVLYLFQSYDQLDFWNCAGIEFLMRWALMIQTAVRRSPKAPDFAGLDAFLSFSLDETGGIIATDFNKFIAEEQKAEAIISKSQRLWRDEQDSENKRRGARNQGKNQKEEV
jgi:hypothetical protein